jgi:hypothetical protein
MESATTLALIAAVLFFSLCLALLAEELVCGAIFRWFFRSAAATTKRKEVVATSGTWARQPAESQGKGLARRASGAGSPLGREPEAGMGARRRYLPLLTPQAFRDLRIERPRGEPPRQSDERAASEESLVSPHSGPKGLGGSERLFTGPKPGASLVEYSSCFRTEQNAKGQ